MDLPAGTCAAEALPPNPPTTTAAAQAAGNDAPVDYSALSDAEVLALVRGGSLKDHMLEAKLKDAARAVVVRRAGFEEKTGVSLVGLPHEGYCYDQVLGANCEVVVGYVPLPCGVVGPLKINGTDRYVPMATTEGCLVASTNRGAKAITQSGGCGACVTKDGITRAPCLLLPTAMEACAVKAWVEDPTNWPALCGAFEGTTSFGKLRSAVCTVAGRNLYVRFVCFAGDAMGMNMVSKGCLAVVALLQSQFPSAQLVSISGNVCSDKKAAAVNWIEGRGKSVVCEATISAAVVEATLKTTVAAMVDVVYRKNLVGSAMAGSMGGFNAHAANIVAAVFLATGQDPAQVVESANCITLVEALPQPDQPNGTPTPPALHISVSMPSVEVGTVGGGTSLPAQKQCLALIGVAGAAQSSQGQKPGDNARTMGEVVAAATLAGELSLLAALASNSLVQAHMQHNRKKA